MCPTATMIDTLAVVHLLRPVNTDTHADLVFVEQLDPGVGHQHGVRLQRKCKTRDVTESLPQLRAHPVEVAQLLHERFTAMEIDLQFVDTEIHCTGFEEACDLIDGGARDAGWMALVRGISTEEKVAISAGDITALYSFQNYFERVDRDRSTPGGRRRGARAHLSLPGVEGGRRKSATLLLV